MTASRLAAGLAAVLGTLGGIALFTAVFATQGVFHRGYVSEAGVPGQPYALLYRVGVLAVALGLILLAAGIMPIAVLPAAIIAVAGVLAMVSGSVACSPGCPLPPYETPTPRDLVHGGASTLSVGLAAFAVLLLALDRRPGPLRRLSRIFLWPLVPLGGAVVFALAALGRGWVIGVGERTLLIVITAWAVLAGYVVARWPPPAGPPAAGRPPEPPSTSPTK